VGEGGMSDKSEGIREDELRLCLVGDNRLDCA